MDKKNLDLQSWVIMTAGQYFPIIKDEILSDSTFIDQYWFTTYIKSIIFPRPFRFLQLHREREHHRHPWRVRRLQHSHSSHHCEQIFHWHFGKKTVIPLRGSGILTCFDVGFIYRTHKSVHTQLFFFQISDRHLHRRARLHSRSALSGRQESQVELFSDSQN